MGRPRGSRVGELDVEKAENYPRVIWERAARAVAGELEDWIKIKSSRNNPTGKNPSRPGEYPKMVSGEFVDGVNVVYSRDNNSLRVYSVAPHGKYLNSGTRNMEPRPWEVKASASRDWRRRIIQVAKALSK